MKKKLTTVLFILLFLNKFCQVATAQSIIKQVLYLSGTDNIHTREWDFWCSSGRRSGIWTKIQVPSNWEQQGFGSYNFGRDNVNFGKNFRFADEKGIYRYNFSVPASWRDQTINLVFEGVMTDAEVKINGKSVGAVHQGGFYRFSYDVKSALDFTKTNQLEVKVSKMSADASVNNAERLADYWIFGGIYRPVYLEAVPKQHIHHVAIDAKADGSFSARILLKNVTLSGIIRTEILDKNGEIVASLHNPISKGDSLTNIKTGYKNCKLWTAETPNLYTARFSLLVRSKIIYQTNEKFGFRTIEVRKQDGIYVNGNKIKLKGVNRHVWWPETGRSVNKQIDIADVELIKGMNMNAVRTSHYPPDRTFLEACDSLGLYVIDELAGWQKAYSTKAGKHLVREMVSRDCNHPSILFWSNGNEGGHNINLDNEFAKYDLSQRTVIHAHHKPGNAINGIDCNHYEDYYSTEKILADTNIYMPTEFLHALDDGGGAAGLSDFWDLHWKSKKGAGGFIWALLDEGIVRTDLNNQIDVNGVNGADGIVGPHREKEASYYAIREIYSPIKITLDKLPENFDGVIPIENRYNFLNINQCVFKWELSNFYAPTNALVGHEVKKTGTALAPSIAPFETGNLKLEMPKNFNTYDLFTLVAFDPYGKEIYKWNWKIKSNEMLLKNLVAKNGNENATIKDNDSTIIMSGGGISVSFSKKSGHIVELKNENGKSLPFGNGPISVNGDSKLSSLKHHQEGNAQVLECDYQGVLSKVKWKMLASGWLEMTYVYTLNGQYPYAGISFSFPDNYVFRSKWLGNGPYRVWKNRPFGVVYDCWENMANNTQTGRAPWIYPEFKGYFSDVTWMELSTVNGKFIVASKQDDLYVRLFDFYGLLGPMKRPALPKGDISFLDAIPPVGTNIAYNASDNASGLGPMSKLNQVNKVNERTLYFYFGTLKNQY